MLGLEWERRSRSAVGGGRKARHRSSVMQSGPCHCHEYAKCGYDQPPHHFLPHPPENPLKTPYTSIYTDPNSGSV